jgi:demethylmenaquinone methyltransferase/2-methoxy-6-polyprenyl-1,4-benzoquinol methylase
MVSGIFERLPFQEETFDVVMCGFSFRDAQNYYAAVREISRVLKHDGGRFLIVDLGKPNGRLQRWLVGLYLRFIAGFLAFLILGRQGLVFSRIYPTYRKYPRINQLRSILNEEFEHVTIDTKMMGGAIISLAEKRNR